MRRARANHPRVAKTAWLEPARPPENMLVLVHPACMSLSRSTHHALLPAAQVRVLSREARASADKRPTAWHPAAIRADINVLRNHDPGPGATRPSGQEWRIG